MVHSNIFAELDTKIRKHYVISGIVKGFVLTGISAAVVSSKVPSFMIAALGLFVAGVLVFTELTAIFPRDMGWHRELVREHGEKYEELLTSAVAEYGYFGIYWNDWIAETSDELMGRITASQKD